MSVSVISFPSHFGGGHLLPTTVQAEASVCELHTAQSGLAVTVGHGQIPDKLAMCQVKYVICLGINGQVNPERGYQMSGQS